MTTGALGCQRDAFSLPGDVHYLNCAYMSPTPRASDAAAVKALARKSVPTSIRADDFFTGADRVRRRFARLAGIADAERVAIVPSASYGIANVVRNTPLERGTNVVITAEQFPSNVYPWRHAAAECGAQVRVVAAPTGAAGRGAAWNAGILEAIDRDTVVVAIGAVHWTDGTRFDLEAIGARARDVGAALIIDGTQSVGAMPFDVAEVRPDALICAAYKWLLGPYSIGVAYYGPRYDDGVPIEHNWITRKGSENFAGLVRYSDEFQPGAVRYDMGERANFLLAPMLEASLDLLLEWRVPRIQRYCEAMLEEPLAVAVSLGFLLEDPAWRARHLVGVRVPRRIPLERVRSALDTRNVMVSLRGNAIRIAPHVYTDRAAAEALCDALAEAAG